MIFFILNVLPRTVGIDVERYKFDVSDYELTSGEDRYRMAFELMSDFVYSAKIADDGNSVYDWTIGDYERMTGYSLDEHLNDPRWMETYIYREDLPAVKEHFSKIYLGQPDVMEYRVLKKDGSLRWLRHYGKPIWSEKLQRNRYIQGAIQRDQTGGKASLAV